MVLHFLCTYFFDEIRKTEMEFVSLFSWSFDEMGLQLEVCVFALFILILA